MKHYIVIYDAEPLFDKYLADFLNSKDSFPFKAKVIDDKAELEAFITEKNPEFILVDEEMEMPIIDIPLILMTHKIETREANGNKIFKYQRADRIIKRIFEIISQENISESLIHRKSTLKLISFYTPERKTFSSTVALSIGKELAKSKKVLYINLECFSGMTKKYGFCAEKDLTDLLYILEGKKDNVSLQIASFIETVSGLDILPVIKNPIDLHTLRYSEWKNLIDKIEQNTDYDYLLLDLSESIDGMYDLLNLSDHIVTTTNTENSEKIAEYEGYLDKSGKQDIVNKTMKLVVPVFAGRIDNDGFAIGEYTTYIKNIMQGLLENE